jgi:hypothetical protein
MELTLRGSQVVTKLKTSTLSHQYTENYSAQIQIYINSSGGLKEIETLPEVHEMQTQGAEALILDPIKLSPDKFEKTTIIGGKVYEVHSTIELKKYPDSPNITDYAVIKTDIWDSDHSDLKYSSSRLISR